MGDPYFGEHWGAPVLEDAPQTDTPVGQSCLRCAELIEDGDRGFVRTTVRQVDGEWVGSPEPVHAECDLIGMVGHTLGVCSCTGFDTSSRVAALEAWDRAGWMGGMGSRG